MLLEGGWIPAQSSIDWHSMAFQAGNGSAFLCTTSFGSQTDCCHHLDDTITAVHVAAGLLCRVEMGIGDCVDVRQVKY